MLYCQRCGSMLESGDVFCSRCGQFSGGWRPAPAEKEAFPEDPFSTRSRLKAMKLLKTKLIDTWTMLVILNASSLFVLLLPWIRFEQGMQLMWFFPPEPIPLSYWIVLALSAAALVTGVAALVFLHRVKTVPRSLGEAQGVIGLAMVLGYVVSFLEHPTYDITQLMNYHTFASVLFIDMQLGIVMIILSSLAMYYLKKTLVK